jgi:hypothetical protein
MAQSCDFFIFFPSDFLYSVIYDVFHGFFLVNNLLQLTNGKFKFIFLLIEVFFHLRNFPFDAVLVLEAFSS